MQHSQTQHHKHRDIYKHKSSQSQKSSTQHGHLHRLHNLPGRPSALLGLPSESLTHITSFLDPHSLFALSGTNKRLHEHVADDNTWRRAFCCQFLGIAPEDTIHDSSDSRTGIRKGQFSMLRREQPSWKREFVHRWNLRRRWEYAPRPLTISHVPVHSTISSIHLMSLSLPNPLLLTASTTYGIVSRSQPLTGKISRGYFDAAGVLNGLGIGNPNAEFSPNLSQCSITSEGGTARILWGFTHGGVAVTNVPRAVELNRAPFANWKVSSREDAHSGAVEHAIWVNSNGTGNHFFVTGSADGHLKVWSAEQVRCLWTSPKKVDQLVRDPCVKVAVDGAHGVVAALFASGDAAVWTGLAHLFNSEAEAVPPKEIRLSAVSPTPRDPDSEVFHLIRQNITLALHCNTASTASLLIATHGQPFFHKIMIDLYTSSYERVIFGRESLCAVSTVQPVFATSGAGHHSFLVVGDIFGYVNIFLWEDTPTPAPETSTPSNPALSVAPVHRFPAFEDGGAVTALVWTPSILVVGSSRGSLKAFDATTFTHLRNFNLPFLATLVDDSVTNLAVEQDMFVATVDDKVFAWKGQPVGRQKHKHTKRNVRASNNSVAKWRQQIEMAQEIMESRREMEHEQVYTKSVLGREREERSTLEHLGLNEIEALEYVLMLSRDEEEGRRRQQRAVQVEVGAIGEFDEDIQTPGAGTSGTQSLFWAPSSPSDRGPSNGRWGASYTRVSSMDSTGRLPVSPLLRPEPMEAGSSDIIARSLSSPSTTSNGNSHGPPPIEDDSQFPSMSSTPTGRSISGSPESHRSAWSTPLKATSRMSSQGPSSPHGAHSPVLPPTSHGAGHSVSLLAARFAQMDSNAGTSEHSAIGERADDDDDLKFAIELSLAEARSRGEDV